MSETETLSRRQRRRVETVREILDAAERQVVEVGAQALSLRAVAREVGMTVQSLYHYFAGRDDLITALVAGAHDAVADAVADARDTLGGGDTRELTIGVARAYRAWAVANPVRFGLAYGMPVADYAAPEDGPTTVGPRRLGAIFADVVFRGWSPAELRGIPLPHRPDGPAVRAVPPWPVDGLPRPAVTLLFTSWGQLHGLVTLEVFGHLRDAGVDPEELFETSMALLADQLARLRAGAGTAAADAPS